MATRTYLSGLTLIVAKLCKYITKYRTVIASQLAGETLVIFNALADACNAYMASAIPEQAKND